MVINLFLVFVFTFLNWNVVRNYYYYYYFDKLLLVFNLKNKPKIENYYLEFSIFGLCFLIFWKLEVTKQKFKFQISKQQKLKTEK